MWNQLFEQCNIRSSIFVLPPCLFKILLQLALSRFNIGKNKFSHDYLCIPNVGKSTLFNALTKTRKAEAANYPFCTIDPNVGVVQVPDTRLQPLANLVGTSTIIPAAIEMVDIAGLVAGASKGEGLGNKFLANVRRWMRLFMVRCFEDEDVIHNMGRVDPIGDAEVIM